MYLIIIVCVYMFISEVDLEYLFLLLFMLFFGSHSLNSGLMNVSRLARQWSPRILFSLSPQHWGYRSTTIRPNVHRSSTGHSLHDSTDRKIAFLKEQAMNVPNRSQRSLMSTSLYSTSFTHGAIFLVLICFFLKDRKGKRVNNIIFIQS